MAYYIKQGQSSIFTKIKINENECTIPLITANKKKVEKIVKKLKKKGIDQVVLDNKTKGNNEFIKYLNNYDIAIIDGKWLMQYMLQDIIEKIDPKTTIEDEITILANDLTNEVNKNIKQFANKYKKIRIVTNHIEKFKRIEQEMYEEKGIPIIITNNKRKALAKSNLIINFDFVEETINQYNIYENAIIINLSDNIKIGKKRFSGSIITDYEVEFKEIEKSEKQELLNTEDILQKQKEYSLKEIIEENIYTNVQKQPNYNLFETIQENIKKYNIKVSKLYGINGEIA